MPEQPDPTQPQGLTEDDRERLDEVIRRVEITAGREQISEVREITEDDATFLRKLADQPLQGGGEDREATIDRVLERFRPSDAAWDMGDGHTQAVNWREVIGYILHAVQQKGQD